MIRKAIKVLISRRHFWRDAGFDELTELYISTMLRTFAVSLLMVFVPFYLYQHGYSVQGIFVFFGLYFTGKMCADILASYFIARFGPKHAMIVSCCLQIVSAAMFLTLPEVAWPAYVLAPITGAAASFFFIAYHVEFSKIKHTPHAGKEIGTMQVFERAAAVLGPLFGGFAGTFLGGQYIFLVAATVLMGSLLPLFRTAEPVRTHQHLDFRGMPLKRALRDYLAYAGLGVENTLCINLWPLYVALFALSGSVYAQLGALTSFAVLVSIIAAHSLGRFIDTHKAVQILRWSAVANSALYIARPFVSSLVPAFMVNLVNEVVTIGYRMPFLKGMYAAADDLPGYRIVYIGSMECIGSTAKATAWFLLALLCGVLADRSVMLIGFIIAAVASIVIMSERFKAIRP